MLQIKLKEIFNITLNEYHLVDKINAKKQFEKRGYDGKFFVQPKLDGIRVVADLATGTLYKRSGVVVGNCPHINKDVLELGFIIPGYNYVDGELYNHKLDFSEINSLVSRTVNLLDTECIELHLFDVSSTTYIKNLNL